MKQIALLLAVLVFNLSVQAHTAFTGSTVTITVNGNKNLQLSVDGKGYDLVSNIATGNKTTVTLTNLESGQHTFLLIRTEQNTNRSDRIATTFNLRYGYDMQVTINGNGSIELIEKKKIGISDDQSPMNATNFNRLLQSVRNNRSLSAKRALINDAFENTSNYFSTDQVIQLIQLINAENARLQLAKLSYRSITDRDNFDRVYDLLNSPSSQTELRSYVDSYSEDENSNVAMTDAVFSSLYQTIQQQRPVNVQVNSLTDAFSNSNNHFSTVQARQLIRLVYTEATRLQLSKLSYRTIVDPGNFNQIYDLLSLQSSKDELTAYINNYSSTSTGTAMSDANFSTLYQTISQKWPVSAQVAALNNAFNSTNTFFTSSQVKQLIQIVTGESNRLQLAKASYRSVVDPINFRQVFDLLNDQNSKNELTSYVNNYAGSNSNLPMADASFNRLYQNIQGQWPVSTQMNSLTNAFNTSNNYFTANQIRQLIQLVSAEDNRLQLAKLSYHTITDRNNFSGVYDLLSSQASKNALTNYINSYSGNNTNLPMTDINYNNLYQTIQHQFFPNEKMNSLTNTFNTAGNYFTVVQAKELIKLISLESNKLQLAKLSYKTITDRDNFTLLNDIFSSQASIDELEAYIRNYKE